MAKNFLSGLFGRRNKDKSKDETEAPELAEAPADQQAPERPVTDSSIDREDFQELQDPQANDHPQKVDTVADSAVSSSAASSEDPRAVAPDAVSVDSEPEALVADLTPEVVEPAPADVLDTYRPDEAHDEAGAAASPVPSDDSIEPPHDESSAEDPSVPIAAGVVEEPASEETPPAEPEVKRGFFSRLKEGLSRTSSKLTQGVADIFVKRKLDDDTLEELEDLLVSADLGVAMAARVTGALAKGRYNKEISASEVRIVLAEEVAKTLTPCEQALTINTAHAPHVVLMTGVNGAGKTTTIGKLAQKYRAEGKSVMLAAGDTFRAAAIEQLQKWGERVGAPVVTSKVGADASGLAYEALQRAQAEGIDVLLIDTAGRLQNRKELMEELAKIVRVLKKLNPDAPHDVILVLDATVGQNALRQAEIFGEIAGVTGLIMTKLDGTAKGGVLAALADKFALPVHYIGVGESADDLQTFSAQAFAQALAGTDAENATEAA